MRKGVMYYILVIEFDISRYLSYHIHRLSLLFTLAPVYSYGGYAGGAFLYTLKSVFPRESFIIY